jgi:hypothetical protein
MFLVQLPVTKLPVNEEACSIDQPLQEAQGNICKKTCKMAEDWRRRRVIQLNWAF